jgi:hypothetical protein
MITKTITYTDFLDEERTETFRFNLSEAELMKWELSKEGTLTEHIKRIQETVDVPKLIDLYSELIDRSYGIMDPTGRKFVKTKEALEDFKATNAYSDLYMELATNQDKGAEFIAGVVSNKLKKLMDEGVKNGTNDQNHPALEQH